MLTEGPANAGANPAQEAELKQLRVSQLMIESCSRLECLYCMGLCRVENFYSHLIDKHSHQMNNPQVFNQTQGQLNIT